MERYIDLMEKTLSAYTEEHIKRYFDHVKCNGLTEHGFPRLTSNIGILIAHGRRAELTPLFTEMMEFCCSTIPTVKAANDFSVREIVACIGELEHSGRFDAVLLEHWKSELAKIEPTSCYNCFARSPEDNVKNWALFTAVSEFYRKKAGIGGSLEFIELQLASQFKQIDENGMYMDGKGNVHHPIVYDLVPRGLFSLLLYNGYDGKYRDKIDDILRRSARLTLKMQSPAGEIAFGGRSNQFIHNEAWLALIFEFEARRYSAEGNSFLAGEFKSARNRALAVAEHWLSIEPIHHIKNRFPLSTKHGCEDYAYFDKYMITVASFLYAAYSVCDDTIKESDGIEDHKPTVFMTSEHFHKLFVKAGGYGLEFDLNADPHYDACGLGRVHREGSPCAVCMSVPCPKKPNYAVNREKNEPLSLCPAFNISGKWEFATEAKNDYKVLDCSCDEHSAFAAVKVSALSSLNAESIVSKYTVNSDGVNIEVSGKGCIGYVLPAFVFDGETYTEIKATENTLEIFYKGWICRYITSGRISATQISSANRNGIYKAYIAEADDLMEIKINISRL